MVQFKNADTAAQYECLFTKDNKIHIPTINYSGLVSNLTLEAAAELVKQKHGKIKEKEATGKSATPPTLTKTGKDAGKPVEEK